MKPATLITVILLAMIAVLHVARLMFSVEVTVAEWGVPMWVSVIAVLVPGALAVWLWRERTQD